jgi:hypothetical protein
MVEATLKFIDRERITIMADYGGAFAWRTFNARGLGGAFDCDEVAGLAISPMLIQDLMDWTREFSRAQYIAEGSFAILEWDRFHARGIELAQKLKAIVGDAACICYEKPYEDPNVFDQECVEILADGALRPVGRAPHQRRFKAAYTWLPDRVISGGQTGVDRAALDWALSNRIPHGGWCPRGRRAEDGVISRIYQLQETESAGYATRTRCNVVRSDATLLLNIGALDGGSARTRRAAEANGKPVCVIQLDQQSPEACARHITAWLANGGFVTLNIAGPRESKRPGVYQSARSVLELCLRGD